LKRPSFFLNDSVVLFDTSARVGERLSCPATRFHFESKLCVGGPTCYQIVQEYGTATGFTQHVTATIDDTNLLCVRIGRQTSGMLTTDGMTPSYLCNMQLASALTELSKALVTMATCQTYTTTNNNNNNKYAIVKH
jgi:hypothetical protein